MALLAFLAFNDFFRPREVFLGINEGQMTTFHDSDIKNSHHTRFAKLVHSANVGRYIHLVNKPKTKVYVGTFRAAKPFIASTDRVVKVVEFKLTR